MEMETGINRTAHHKNSPSSLERRALCPGSMRAEDGLPNLDTEHSAEGTRLHALVAEAIKGKAEIINTDDEYIVGRCIEFIKSFGDPDKMVIEEKIKVYGTDFKPMTEGTPDLVLVFGRKGVLVDWKFGRNKVADACRNLQMAAYALGVADAHELEEVEAIVYQPYIGHESRFTYTGFESIRQHIANIISLCEGKDAPRIPSEKACRYCKAARDFRCPEFLDNSKMEIATIEEKLPIGVSALTDDQLGQLKAKEGEIMRFFASVKTELRNRIEIAHSPVGGYELKSSTGRAEVHDPAGAYTALKDVVTAEEFASSCKVSLSQLSDIYAKKSKEMGKNKTLKDGKAEAKDKLSWCLSYGAPVIKLVKVGGGEDESAE